MDSRIHSTLVVLAKIIIRLVVAVIVLYIVELAESIAIIKGVIVAKVRNVAVVVYYTLQLGVVVYHFMLALLHVERV